LDPYLGEIRLFPWDWPPTGWALCNGALMSIAQNSALFALLGTFYGGDGRQTFALPDLRGRTPIHYGNVYPQGAQDGTENVTLTLSMMPQHTHLLKATSSTADALTPVGHVFAQVHANGPAPHYVAPSAYVPLNPASVQPAGSSQPHQNMQPYLVLNYCIATTGIFPSRN
jgi:microcystin-dependent protein